jgi:hypothetical protein
VPLIGEQPVTNSPPEFALLDTGREPRVVLMRGPTAGAQPMWLLTLEESMHMGVDKMGVWHMSQTMLLEPAAPDATRLRFTVSAADPGPMRIEGGTLTGEERAEAQAMQSAEIRKQVGDYFEVLLGDDGQPVGVDPAGDKDPMFVGKMMAAVMAMPGEPLGVGAHWTAKGRQGSLSTSVDMKVTDRRDGVTTVDARIVNLTGPFRQVVNGKRQTFWAQDDLRETWKIDLGTPVTAFAGSRELRSFIAECVDGRIQVHPIVHRSSVRFQRVP